MLSTRRQTILRLGSALLGAAAVPAFAAPPGPPGSRPSPMLRERLLPLSLITGSIREQLAGLQIRLHNYRENEGRGGHDHNASFIRFSETDTQAFDIETAVHGRSRVYINDVNLASSSVSTVARRGWKLTLSFESDGEEIKAHCRGTGFRCVGAVPDMNIDHMRVEVVLEPRPYRGSITLVPTALDFFGEIRATGACSVVDYCNAFGHYRVSIRRAMQRQFGDRFGSASMKEKFARAFRPSLTALEIGNVTAVAVRNTSLVVTYIVPLL